MNTIACKNCRFYHEQYVYKALRRMVGPYGFCAKTSKYPQVDPDGMNPPPCDVVRVGPNERPHLVVLQPTEVRGQCMHASKKEG